MNMLLKTVTFVCLVNFAMALHPCDLLVPRGGNGFANDPSGCSFYFSCNQGTFTRVSCPAGHHYRETTQTCIVESESDCQVCPATGITQVANEISCRHWTLCINGVERPQTCSPGTSFSPDVRSCVPNVNSTCTLDACGGTSDGFIANPTNCSSYHLCVDGITVETTNCHTPLQFDHISGGCAFDARCYPGSSTVATP